MKRLFTIILLVLSLTSYSQSCISAQQGWIIPGGPFSPGQVVTVNYNLISWNQINLNWIIAFQFDFGPGWTNITPGPPPANTSTQSGFWMWDNQHTFPSGLNFGPGYRFVNTGIFPDWGSSSTGPLFMSFTVTVAQTCTPDNLSISIQAFGDCQTGGWWNGPCCNDPALNIYNGVVQVPPILTSNINHY